MKNRRLVALGLVSLSTIAVGALVEKAYSLGHEDGYRDGEKAALRLILMEIGVWKSDGKFDIFKQFLKFPKLASMDVGELVAEIRKEFGDGNVTFERYS